MRDLFTVASFTMKDMVKRKTFIISNIIILLIIVIGFNVPSVIQKVKGNDTDSGKDVVLVVDNENIFSGSLETLNQLELGYRFEVTNTSLTREEIKEKLEKEEINSCITFQETSEGIHTEYIVKSLGAFGEMPKDLMEVFSNLYTQVQIGKLGLTQDQVAKLQANFNMEVVQTDENPAGGNIFAIMMLSIVLFYAIYFCAYQVSSSITTEKTSKIMETLVTSTTPRTIVLGKTLGIGMVGMLQVLTIIIVSVVCAKLCLAPEIIESIFDMSNITPMLAIIIVVYFILGYALYALLYALTGSTVSKPEDINSANGPIAIIAVIGFYLAYFAMMNPGSSINVFASILPVSAPFSMPFRVMMGTATTTELITSLAVLLITIIIVAQISIKIYSSAILNYGKKLNVKDMFKIYKQK